MKPVRPRHVAWLLAALCLPCTPATAANLDFTVAASEPVVVTGTPRIAIDVGGVTRYATYASGSGTSTLTFSYAVQAGDFDSNGLTLAAPLDLNAGGITDVAGNPVSGLTFTLPDTSALKVQTYTASFTTSPITNANANAVSFAIAKAPTGASFTYSITSDGGAGSVTGSGTIGGNPHTVSGVDVSALLSGMLTLSIIVSTTAGGTGISRTATATPILIGALDSLPAVAAAFSVRRLTSAYAGPLLRVRRSSDNASQDIGATVEGNLSTTALTSFCSIATCYVVTWYDQSGNGRDATQPTTAAQPTIANGGAMELLGSRPAVRFANTLSLGAPAPLNSSSEFTISLTSVERTRRSNFTWRLLEANTASLRVLAAMPWTDGLTYFDLGSIFGGNRISSPWPVPIGTPAVATFQNSASANTRGIYLDGSLFLSGDGYAAPSDTLKLGENYIGHFAEFILFPSSITSPDRLAIERSQGAYYGVTVP